MARDNSLKNTEEIIELIDQLMKSILTSGYGAVDKNILPIILNSSGKKIRTRIVIALACILETIKIENIVKIGAAIELFHLSSLLHDDVIDSSDYRRGKKTINYQWDDKTAILFGDFVYGKSLFLVGKLQDPKISLLFSNLTYSMAFSELVHYHTNNHLEKIGYKTYFKLIQNKTAKLFLVSCFSIFLLSEQKNNPKLKFLIHKFSLNLGYCFQIFDDLADYIMDEHYLGKEVGQDFYNRKITLPIIHLFQTKDEQIASDLFEKKQKNTEDLKEFHQLLKKNKSLEFTLQIGNRYFEKSKNALELFLIELKQESLFEQLIGQIYLYIYRGIEFEKSV